MAKYPGYLSKIMIGTVTVGSMNKWGLPERANTIIDKSVFEGAFETFCYGQAKGGKVNFSGFYDPDDATGQSILLAAWVSKASFTNLRIYFGTAATEFFHLTAGATCRIESVDIGEADRSGLVPISFTMQVSGGFFEKAVAYNASTVTFSHVAGPNNDTITKSGGTSYITLGYVAGQNLIVEGSGTNDGALVIYSVAANVLTVTSDTLNVEVPGPTVALIAMQAGPPWV